MNNEWFDPKEVAKEAEIQNSELNVTLGVGAFLIALACLGTPDPQATAFFCSPMIIFLASIAVKSFPPTIDTIRTLYRETHDPEVKEVLDYLTGQYLGFKSLAINAFGYWYGAGFFLVVLASPEFTDWLKAI